MAVTVDASREWQRICGEFPHAYTHFWWSMAELVRMRTDAGVEEPDLTMPEFIAPLAHLGILDRLARRAHRSRPVQTSPEYRSPLMLVLDERIKSKSLDLRNWK